MINAVTSVITMHSRTCENKPQSSLLPALKPTLNLRFKCYRWLNLCCITVWLLMRVSLCLMCYFVPVCDHCQEHVIFLWDWLLSLCKPMFCNLQHIERYVMFNRAQLSGFSFRCLWVFAESACYVISCVDADADARWLNNVMLSQHSHPCCHTNLYALFTSALFSFSVQNGAVTQKDTLNDDEFEPYLNNQARQVSLYQLVLAKRCFFFSWITLRINRL